MQPVTCKASRSRFRVLSVFSVLIATVLLGAVVPTAQAGKPTIRLKLKGREIEGMPLSADNNRVNFLARDGYWWEFSPREASDYKQTSPSFRAFSQSEMRGLLLKEFGKKYSVSGTGNYLVVHPRGQKDIWARRFEELYRSFQLYFRKRGMYLKRPQFPLVAVVFNNQSEFRRHAAREGISASRGLLGYYLPMSNRIILFDRHDGKSTSKNWHQNAETIIHEAAHQTAFNTGVHNRFALPPRWIAEGLGTLFEAPGVYDSRHHTAQRDRLNRGRLKDFQYLSQNRRPKKYLETFIASDRPFFTDPGLAYAEAWALTFYLSENEPRKYVQLLNKTARRRNFSNYSSSQRVNDFALIFGRNLEMLETRYLRFIATLK